MPTEELGSLDPKSFHVMVVLARKPMHGYAIRQQVEARTDGAVRLWPATLYGLLASLSERGLIQEASSPGGPDDDPRRRYYALTASGRKTLAAEAARLEELARLARANLATGKAGA
ncbi:MAG: helix-turn-helix transcriptional regulator [Acidobacteriota bacterium]|nr:helix-turn-helix transcriptional regulator [Acidobacteriota bacterium]